MIEQKISTKLFHNKEQLEACIKLLASMSSDRTLIFQKLKFFIYSKTDEDIEYSVDRTQVDGDIFAPLNNVLVTLEGVTKELFNEDELRVLLPIQTEGKNITLLFKDCFRQIVKHGYFDDMNYHAYLLIINAVNVFFKDGKIGFGFKNATARRKVIRGGRATIIFEDVSLEKVLEAEIQQGYVNKEIGDHHRDYGYTHLLRANAEFFLTTWFKNVILNWKKINVIFASRGQGKTFDASYIGTRELLNPNPGFGGRKYREIKYFVDNKDTIGDNFFKYVKSLLGDLVGMKVNGEKVFKVSESTYSIECTLTGNRIEVVSLYKLTRNSNSELGDSTGEGIACDVAIIDEAARIPDKFWNSFYQRASFETESFFIITTANEETPVDHWAYELLIKGELGDPLISSYRITIDDNEILKRSVPKEQVAGIIKGIKEDIKEKSGLEAYYARLYCIIFDKKKIFQIQSNLIPRRHLPEDNLKIIILDPAKLSDNAGLTLIDVKEHIIEKSEKLINSDYGFQLSKLDERKNKYKNSVVICDRGGVGEFLSEADKDGIVDIRIKSTGQGELNFNKNKGFYTISKGLIINSLDTFFRKRVLFLFDDLTDLIYQLGKFVEVKSSRSKIVLYKGEGKEKDDLVLSLANGACYLYNVLGLHTRLDFEKYANQFDNSEVYSYTDSAYTDEGYYNPVY